MTRTSVAGVLLCALLIAVAFRVTAAQTTLAYQVTTVVDPETNLTVCYCPCEDMELAANRSASAPSTEEEALKAGQELQEQLKLDRSNLSSSTRRKTSAPDDRPSAQGIGAVGVVVLVSVVAAIVILDLTTLIHDIKLAFRRLCWGIEEPAHRRFDARAYYKHSVSPSVGFDGHDDGSCAGLGAGAMASPSNELNPDDKNGYDPVGRYESPEHDEGYDEDSDDGDDRRIVLTKPEMTVPEGSGRRGGNAFPDIKTRRELLEMQSLNK